MALAPPSSPAYNTPPCEVPMPFLIRHSLRFSGQYAISYDTGLLLRWPLTWLLIIIVALSNGPVYAEWVGIFFTKNAGGYDVYVDPHTVQRKGDLVKMWVLYDYKTRQSATTGITHLSDSIQVEANCTEKLQRRHAYTWWSGNMGDGNVVFTYSGEGNWIPIQSGTIGHTVWSFACSKK